MKRAVAIILVSLLILTYLPIDNASAQSGSWTTKLSMSTARIGLAIGVVNEKIYAIGGYKEGSGYLNINEEYNPENNTWTTRTPMPTSRAGLGVGVVNGKIYAIGGNNGDVLKVVEEYDPTTDNWTARTSMPTGRSHLAVEVVNGKIYAIGGFTNDISFPDWYNGAATDRNEEYDPVTDSWTMKAPLPTPRGCLGAATVNNKIYAIGGYRSSGGGWGSPTYKGFNLNERYVPGTNTWDTMEPMPTTRGLIGISSVNGKIYVIGGKFYSYTMDVNQEFNPTTNSWTAKTAMPTPRYGLAAGTVAGKIYAIGGRDDSYLTKNEEYTPSGTTPPPNNPPTASLSASPTTVLIGEQVSFNGGASYDPDSGDTVTQYFFNYGDGQDSGWITYSTRTHSYSSSGTYITSLTVRDEEGLESTNTATISITVNQQQSNNPPTCTITSPTNGVTVDSTFVISISVTDTDGNSDIESVQVRIDTESWQTASLITAITWTLDWDTTQYTNGLHTIYARAYDGDDYSTVQSVTITVSNENGNNGGNGGDNGTSVPFFKTPLFLSLICAVIIGSVIIGAILYSRKKRIPPEPPSQHYETPTPPDV